MGIMLQGQALNQRQLDAIVPVMNQLLSGKVKKKGFEKACIEALENAGCPVGYDRTLPGPDASIVERGEAWLLDGETGSSSLAIYRHMTGRDDEDGFSHPHDPSDLNRCLLLLELIPEWKPRMPEMAERSQDWAALVARWDEIVESFVDEAGIGWSKGKKALRTYALMKSLRAN